MDRKAWIVIVLCCIGIAVNFHFNKKNQELVQEQQRQVDAEKEVEEEKKASKENATNPPDPNNPDTPPEPVPEPVAEEQFPTLRTRDAIFTFTTYGGGIEHVEMVGQFAVGDKKHSVRLNEGAKHPIGLLTTGVDEYELDIIYTHKKELDTDKSVTFLGETTDGLRVGKTWTLLEDEKTPGYTYRLKLALVLINHGESPVELKNYGLFAGRAAPLWDGEWPRHMTFFYNKDGDYSKRRVTKFKKGKKPAYQENKGGMLEYAGVSNQFFATIISPEKPYESWIWGNREAINLPEAAGGGSGEAIRMALSLPDETLIPGGDNTESISYQFYLGPKRNQLLRKMGEDRKAVMNYWPFGWISSSLNWLLNVLYSWIFTKMSSSWGWGFAIVALTILIRGAMWPLQNKSTRAMKRMSKLQPQMAEMKEKYADDPARMNQEMMKMYREYGINPLGGCLPLLVQIPIFFGFYTMLQYAVELRQEGFLWVADLSQPDTIFELPFKLPIVGWDGVNLLPIVMAATMVLQMALTPKTGDKMQRRLFMLMPVIFFFFCYNFASALALYWTTSNIFAIAQMLITRRLPEPELKKKKKANKKGMMQKLQDRAEAAQKSQKAQRAEKMGGARPKKPKKRGPRTGG